jgi:hypothetical protein
MLDITNPLTTHTSDCDGLAHVLHDAVGHPETHSGTLVTFLWVVFMHVVHQKDPLSVYTSPWINKILPQIQVLVCRESLRSCVGSF